MGRRTTANCTRLPYTTWISRGQVSRGCHEEGHVGQGTDWDRGRIGAQPEESAGVIAEVDNVAVDAGVQIRFQGILPGTRESGQKRSN
eukprot:2824432-Rhodomonas_salina.1